MVQVKVSFRVVGKFKIFTRSSQFFPVFKLGRAIYEVLEYSEVCLLLGKLKYLFELWENLRILLSGRKIFLFLNFKGLFMSCWNILRFVCCLVVQVKVSFWVVGKFKNFWKWSQNFLCFWTWKSYLWALGIFWGFFVVVSFWVVGKF